MTDALLFLGAASLWVMAAAQVRQLWDHAAQAKAIASHAQDADEIVSIQREYLETTRKNGEQTRAWEEKHAEAHRDLGKTLHSHKPVKEEAIPVEQAH